MEVMEFKVNGKHELDLACISVMPKKEPKAVIQIFHGMGEHKNRYIPFMKYLAENGFAVYAHDHRNHGESIRGEDMQGIFQSNDTWDDVLDDAYFVSRKIMKDLPGKKMIILGHSMGSIIARGFLGRYATVAKAAIIMGTLPKWGLTDVLAPLMLARILSLFTGNKRSKLIADAANKPMLKEYTEPRTKFDWLSHNEENVDKYIEDPLCGYAYNPRFYIQFFKGMVEVNKSDFIMLQKDIPILFISGLEDPVGEKGEGVKEIHSMYTGHGFLQLDLKLIENARHEILNENNREETFELIKNWLLEKL
jgi:alpha-beta hydrolase superfamily lysophospholipase